MKHERRAMIFIKIGENEVSEITTQDRTHRTVRSGIDIATSRTIRSSGALSHVEFEILFHFEFEIDFKT